MSKSFKENKKLAERLPKSEEANNIMKSLAKGFKGAVNDEVLVINEDEFKQNRLMSLL